MAEVWRQFYLGVLGASQVFVGCQERKWEEEKVWTSSLSPKAAFSPSEVKFWTVTCTADLIKR